MRKIGKLLLLFLLLAAAAGLCAGPAFAGYDGAPERWAEDAIERWSSYGVIEAAGEGGSGPDSVLTRAELAEILSNMLGLTKMAENAFSDVSSGAWYEGAVLRCAAAGILLGDNGRAMPDKAASRQEAVVMTVRALGVEPANAEQLRLYSDAADVADWAAPYLAALVADGAVGGVGEGLLAPSADMGLAAAMTVFDRVISQYINASGEYTLTTSDGLVVIAAGDVTLTGATPASVLITPAADGTSVIFENASVSGKVTVQAENAMLTVRNSELPILAVVGEGTMVKEAAAPASSAGSNGGSFGSFSGHGNSVSPPASPEILTISEPGAYGGVYDGVVIAARVGNGDVTLDNMTINGDLTIQGGGSDSVRVDHSRISGSITLNKAGIDGSAVKAPRLVLTGTDADTIRVLSEAIIEAEGADVAIRSVSAEAALVVRGEQTQIERITVPAEAAGTVAVTAADGRIGELVADGAATVVVGSGTIDQVTANAETTIAASGGLSTGSVGTVVVSASVSVDSAVVDRIVVPQSAPENIEVYVAGNEAIAVQTDSSGGVKIETQNAIAVDVSGSGKSAAKVSVAGGSASPPKEYVWVEVPAEKADAAGIKELLNTSGALDALTDADVPQPAAANCTTAGQRVFAALDSGTEIGCVFKTERVSKTAHMPEEVAAVAATCTQDGKTAYIVCAVCGAELTVPTIIAATGHDWDMENGQVTRAPTCSQPGIWTYSCRNDAEYTATADIPIDPDAHEWEEIREITETDIWSYIAQDPVVIDGEEVAWDTENLALIQSAYQIRICIHDGFHYELVPAE